MSKKCKHKWSYYEEEGCPYPRERVCQKCGEVQITEEGKMDWKILE